MTHVEGNLLVACVYTFAECSRMKLAYLEADAQATSTATSSTRQCGPNNY